MFLGCEMLTFSLLLEYKPSWKEQGLWKKNNQLLWLQCSPVNLLFQVQIMKSDGGKRKEKRRGKVFHPDIVWIS